MASWLPSWVPPLQDFFPPTPEAFNLLLNTFKYFPIVTAAQWLNVPQPTGKTSLNTTSLLNYPGRWAWCIMELVGPLNMTYILLTLPQKAISPSTTFSTLPFWNKIMGCLYILHYSNRAVITPLFLAPSIAPIHLVVAACASLFNFVNSSNIGAWVAGYGRGVIEGEKGYWKGERREWSMWVGLVIFFVGLLGNIWAENALFWLRREEVRKRQMNGEKKQQNSQEKKNPHEKVYVIPPKTLLPLYSHILYPHYVFEWLEWTGFLIIGGGVRISSSSTSSSFFSSSSSSSSRSLVSSSP